MAAACPRPPSAALAGDRASSARTAGPRLPAPPALARPSRAVPRVGQARPRADKQDGRQAPPPLPTETDFDADAPPGFWDSPAAGYLSIGAGIAALAGCLVLLLSLARPVIDATVGAFPVRGG